jgi:hypothetical protein
MACSTLARMLAVGVTALVGVGASRGVEGDNPLSFEKDEADEEERRRDLSESMRPLDCGFEEEALERREELAVESVMEGVWEPLRSSADDELLPESCEAWVAGGAAGCLERRGYGEARRASVA